jgi:hypothetical protein
MGVKKTLYPREMGSKLVEFDLSVEGQFSLSRLAGVERAVGGTLQLDEKFSVDLIERMPKITTVIEAIKNKLKINLCLFFQSNRA